MPLEATNHQSIVVAGGWYGEYLASLLSSQCSRLSISKNVVRSNILTPILIWPPTYSEVSVFVKAVLFTTVTMCKYLLKEERWVSVT